LGGQHKWPRDSRLRTNALLAPPDSRPRWKKVVSNPWRSRVPQLFGALVLLAGVMTSCSSASSNGNTFNNNTSDGNCSVCSVGCSNGLVTSGLVLDPPGCGTQCATSFCPGGCSLDGKVCLASTLADGGLGSCVASQLTATQGLLRTGGVAVSQGYTILLATSAALACALASDAGTAPANSAVSLVINFPPSTAGTVTVMPGAQLAVLTTWNDGGVVERTAATAGAVVVNVSQPGGGLIGSYQLQFGMDAEEGSFTAPACDVCVTPP